MSRTGIGRGRLRQVLAAADEGADIRTRVVAVPDMTIGELRAWMLATYSVSVGHAVMWETLRRLELPLKKTRHAAEQAGPGRRGGT
jgi:transposase